MNQLPDRIGPSDEAVREASVTVVDARFDVAPIPEATKPLRPPPILGALAVIFGITALYKATLVLAPIALLVGAAALFRRQGGWGLIGIGAAVVALAITPSFWALLGLAWLLDRYGWLLTYLG